MSDTERPLAYYKRSNRTIQIHAPLRVGAAPQFAYEIDLDRCSTSAELLDHIAQVALGKVWATPEVIAAMLAAIDDGCHQVFSAGLQAVYCPGGIGQDVDWRRGAHSPAGPTK